MSFAVRVIKLGFVSIGIFLMLSLVLFVVAFFYDESRIGEIDAVKIVFQAQCRDGNLAVESRHFRGGFDAPDQTKFYLVYNKKETLMNNKSFSAFDMALSTHFLTYPSYSKQANIFTQRSSGGLEQISLSSNSYSIEEYEEIKDCILDNYETFADSYKSINSIAYIDTTLPRIDGTTFACNETDVLEFSHIYDADYIILRTPNLYSVPIVYIDEQSKIRSLDLEYISDETSRRRLGREVELRNKSRIEKYNEIEDKIPFLLSTCKSPSKSVLDYFELYKDDGNAIH